MRLLKKLFTKEAIALYLILIIALLVRLYKINAPLADYHSWRQVDTASVAKIFTEEGFNLLKPRYHDLSPMQSGKENPQGYRMVEFPIYNAAFALLYKYIGVLPIEVYGRLVSIFLTLISISILFYLLRKEFNFETAILGSLAFSLLPFFVFFTRVVLPEPTATGLYMISLFFGYLFSYAATRKKALLYLIPCFVFFSLSLLVKPTTIFFLLPIFYLFYRRYDIFVFTRPQFYLYFLLVPLPMLIWRLYILRYPEGIPAFGWLTTHVNTPEGLKPVFFKPSFFYWIFFERIAIMMLGGWLVFFFTYGLLRNTKALFIFFTLAAAAYLFSFQGGNVQHEYYQTIIFPVVSALIAIGFYYYKKQTKHKIFTYPIFLIIFIFSIYFSYKKVKPFYRIPGDLINYSKIIKTFTEKDDLIITDREGDTTLLYLSDRKGYPYLPEDLTEVRKKGYKYIATAHPDKAKELLEKYKFLKPVFQSDKFYILKFE